MEVEFPRRYNQTTTTPRKHLRGHLWSQSRATVIKLIEELDKRSIVEATHIVRCQISHHMLPTPLLMQTEFSPGCNKSTNFAVADEIRERPLGQPRSMHRNQPVQHIRCRLRLVDLRSMEYVEKREDIFEVSLSQWVQYQ